MALSGVVGTKRDGQIKLKDSGGTNSLIATLEVGDFTFDLSPPADRIVVRDRGAISGLRRGDDSVGSCSFSVHFTEFTNATAGTILDFIHKLGFYNGNTSVGGTGYEQYLVDIEFDCDKTTLGDAAVAKATLTKVFLFANFSEGDTDSVSFTGEVYGTCTYSGIS